MQSWEEEEGEPRRRREGGWWKRSRRRRAGSRQKSSPLCMPFLVECFSVLWVCLLWTLPRRRSHVVFEGGMMVTVGVVEGRLRVSCPVCVSAGEFVWLLCLCLCTCIRCLPGSEGPRWMWCCCVLVPINRCACPKVGVPLDGNQ